jgi:hypothetical protein
MESCANASGVCGGITVDRLLMAATSRSPIPAAFGPEMSIWPVSRPGHAGAAVHADRSHGKLPS